MNARRFREHDSLEFDFKNICFDNEDYTSATHHLRFFKNLKEYKFKRDVWECLSDKGEMKDSGVSIKHFLPRENAKEIKKTNWYDANFNRLSYELIEDKAPSQIEGFNEWKEYNPKRDDFE